MKQTRLLKTLLAAVCLFVGTSAWGDGTKRILNSVDYESATASDWAGPNITNTLESGHATYGKYVKVLPSGTGNRSAYKSVAFAYTAGSGKTASDMATTGYVIEFDMLMSGGNTKDRSESQFIIPTTGPNLATNTTYSGTDYIFALSQKQRDAASRITGWYINDLTNTTDKTVALDYSTWYHYKIVVTGTSVTYTITHNNQTDATGSKTVETLPTIKGFFGCLGRGSGEIRFDNLEIYDYTEDIVVAAPTFSFNKVDGANRNYTITNSNGSGTLYYTTTPAEEAPAKGDAAYSSTTDLSKTLDYGTSGKYYAYVLHSNGTTSSAITTQTVTAGELTLAAPVFKIEDMVLAEDGYYYPKVSFTSTNSLEGNPVPTYNIESPYTFNGIGYIDVTASAKGYTSSTSRYTVSTRYSKSKTIDFGALTANDFDANVWSSGTGAPRDYWTNRAAAIPADVQMRYLTTTSTEVGNPDNSSVVSGITISNYNQRAPEFCIGYGMYTPYAAISGSGNNMTFSVNDATADDIIVYNGWNDYGSGTFNTVQTGEKSFNLYRYDTMLRTINVYSPVASTVSATITSAGWATLYTPYALNFEGTGLTAYTATLEDNKVTLVPVDNVPANTGVVLEGAADTYYIPVVASSKTAKGDLLGSADATAFDAYSGYTLYILTQNGNNVQFNPCTSGSIAAGKAFLKVATDNNNSGGAKALSVVFANDPTGISTVNATETAQPVKRIVNGQLVIEKNGKRYNAAGAEF